MTNSLSVAIAQVNIIVGDFQGNITKHIDAAEYAREQGADIIVFPELSLTGYSPDDLLLRQDFLEASAEALTALLARIQGIYCLVGHPLYENKKRYNACTLFFNGQIVAQYRKQHLPNYGVFDEARYFTPGDETVVVEIKNTPVALLICEDIWRVGSIQHAVSQGATLILVPNASPFESNKHEVRTKLLTNVAKKHNINIIYANLVGGQDELVFDGGSMAVNNVGEVQHVMPFFKEAVHLIDFKNTAASITPPTQMARIYQALCLGVSDYINKNNIKGALIGLSGGIDSALTLAIAVDALGYERVHAVMMPSEHTSAMSQEDAATLAKNLGVRYDIIPITDCYRSFSNTITPHFTNAAPAIMFENLQARARGTILMALSNATGNIVLNTGNRSELATGYCTLYGDMVGGFAVLKDVLKTEVYELSHFRNSVNPIIPERILSRAPTAELAPNQKDEDSLPPYPILDQILKLFCGQLKSRQEITALGITDHTVEKVMQLVRQNEYKRKQAPIGPHINHKSFGKDWRFPLTNRWKS